jgi:hypothetical protein
LNKEEIRRLSERSRVSPEVFFWDLRAVYRKYAIFDAGAELSMTTAPVASVSWEGDSWETLKSWSSDMRHDFGVALREMQEGRRPTMAARPMQSVGNACLS